ncbi:Crp/Fnr family transcriptional regulator [Carboxylicivirga litoralis]|uniref:Crp/Fnr family transcriptional regulator n=1 Tax=Carboxylicivirga litoralis TaxID=2816963 RepID=UPI0021CB8D16|nr:Crp/Fnr family transcriptional regulator [Carboxylicivirga sp. A043]
MTITKEDYQLLYDCLAQNAELSQHLFTSICTIVQKEFYQKGECLLKAGDISTRSCLVIKGVVHQFVYDIDETITTNITPQYLFFNSLKSYIEGSPSIEIHEAITDVELLYFEKQDIEELAKKDKELSYLLYKVHENILLDRENRMFLLQHRNPSKRYQLFHETVERSNWILDGTPDKYIASYLNMTPQQYSKEKRNYLLQKND